MHTPIAARGRLALVSSGFIIWFALASGIRLYAEAPEFQVSGELQMERFFNGKLTQRYPSTEFKAFVRGCKWYIYMKPAVAADWDNGHVEIAYDGESTRGFGAGGRLTPAAGIDDGDIVSPGAEPRLPILWTAFAAGCYLRKAAGSGKLIPPDIRSQFRKPIPAEVEWLDEAASIPARILYFDDGTNRMEYKEVAHPPPFDKGYTNGIYTVAEYTNIGSLKLPLRFEFDQFFPAPSQAVSSNDIMLGLHLEGRVLTVAARCDQISFVPELPPTPIRTTDGRFMTLDVGASRFTYTTNHWLSKAEAMELPKFKDYVRTEALEAVHPVMHTQGPYRLSPAPQGSPGGSRNRSRIRIVFFLLGAAFVAALALFCRLRHGSAQPR